MSDSKKNHQGLDPDVTEKLQRQAAELAESVNAGDYGRAMSLINDLSEVKDQSLYREVGRLTRSLHEAIRNFQIDPRNAEQKEALSKMTDASDRLEYVVQMTAQAANRTMDLVEESMPMAHAMRDEAAALRQEWQRLRRREMQPDEFRDLYARIDTFFSKLTGDADTLYGNLSEILLAQDFQGLDRPGDSEGHHAGQGSGGTPAELGGHGQSCRPADRHGASARRQVGVGGGRCGPANPHGRA